MSSAKMVAILSRADENIPLLWYNVYLKPDIARYEAGTYEGDNDSVLLRAYINICPDPILFIWYLRPMILYGCKYAMQCCLRYYLL